jgi:hypothetical protein
MTQGELAAQQLMSDCAEHGYVIAECAENKTHPCVIVWSAHSTEQIGAWLHAIATRAHSAGGAGACEALEKEFGSCDLESWSKAEILDFLACAKRWWEVTP